MPNPSIQAISTPLAPLPVGPYSQAVLAGGWLYCSGQIAIDPSTNLIIGQNDVEEETKQVLKNLLAVLKAADADITQVVRTTIYLIDLGDFEVVNKVYASFFTNEVSPARACVQVAALPKSVRVEIDCIAWLG